MIGKRLRFWEGDHEEKGTIVAHGGGDIVRVQWDNPCEWMTDGESNVHLHSVGVINRTALLAMAKEVS